VLPSQAGADLAAAGIGNDDGLVVVVDVEDVSVLDGPSGKAGKFPGWAPKIVFDGNGPTGFDFKGVADPGAKAKLLSTVLRKGTGATVEKGDLMVLDIVSSVYDAKEPFQNTFAPDMEPQPVPVGASSIQGLNEVLENQTVGSRIVMRIPPAKAFGDQAQGELIPAGSTLYFVIDILAAV
jgi:peptidylprolyl isomerase